MQIFALALVIYCTLKNILNRRTYARAEIINSACHCRYRYKSVPGVTHDTTGNNKTPTHRLLSVVKNYLLTLHSRTGVCVCILIAPALSAQNRHCLSVYTRAFTACVPINVGNGPSDLILVFAGALQICSRR